MIVSTSVFSSSYIQRKSSWTDKSVVDIQRKTHVNCCLLLMSLYSFTIRLNNCDCLRRSTTIDGKTALPIMLINSFIMS